MTMEDCCKELMDRFEQLEGHKQALVEVHRAVLRALIHRGVIDPAELTEWLAERALLAQNDSAHDSLSGWIEWLDNHCEVPDQDEDQKQR